MARKNAPDQPKPWAALGISESTYYRRKRAGTLSADCQPKVEKTVKSARKTAKPKTVTVKSAKTVKKAPTVILSDSAGDSEKAASAVKKLPAHLNPDVQFKPGQSGNPAGRAKGSRNKITEAFVSEMCAHFQQHGLDAIERVFKDKPEQYINAIVRLVPQQVEVGEAGAFDGMSDVELDALLAQRMASLHRHQADNSRWMQ